MPSTTPTDALAGKLKRTEIQHTGSSIPGREIVQVLTEIPAGVESGWHMHPGEEVGYILAGTVKMEIRDKPTLTLHTGDGFLMPPEPPTTPPTSDPTQARCSQPTSSKSARRSRHSPTNEAPATSLLARMTTRSDSTSGVISRSTSARPGSCIQAVIAC